MAELVDTHCHLYSAPLAADIDAVLARARAAGVGPIVVPAYDHASFADVLRLVARPGVYGALGLHPWVAAERLDEGRLVAGLQQPGVVAVGEIGLDFRIPDADPPRQIALLRRQLHIAAALGRPVILHCRGAFEEMLQELEAFKPPLAGVLHAFSRGPELAARFAGLGLHLGFGGAVTRPDARARRAATAAPLRHIVCETDAPSIGLQGVPAAETEPRHVADVAAALAELRGLSFEAVAAATTENARALFGLPTPGTTEAT